MTFSTGLFIIGLLPWFILIYSVWGRNKRRMRIMLIALANCVFLIRGGAGSFLFICAFAVIIRLFSLLISKIKKRWILALCIVFAVMLLVFFKYTVFLIGMMNPLSDSKAWTSSIVVPIGISFVTFEAVSLLADIYRGKTDEVPGIIDTWLYLSFFPTVTSGPIIRFDEFEGGLTSPSFSFDRAASIERIAVGLCKKTLIADKVAILADYYFDGIASGSSYSAAGLWLGSIAYTLQLYFDFSGYSDMAIGIGQLMGFDIRENFNSPYQADSISDFWKRWHMSLTQWFRDYVYIPLGGNRCRKLRHVFNMLVVWFVTGLWHGADWTFILWGLGYFILLTAEKYVPVMKKITGNIAGHIYTLFFVDLLWIPFRSDNMSAAVRYIRGMFAGGLLIEDKAVRFMPLLVLAVLLCFPWNRLLSRFADKKWFCVIKGVTMIILTAFAICGAVNSTYSPYIYGDF